MPGVSVDGAYGSSSVCLSSLRWHPLTPFFRTPENLNRPKPMYRPKRKASVRLSTLTLSAEDLLREPRRPDGGTDGGIGHGKQGGPAHGCPSTKDSEAMHSEVGLYLQQVNGIMQVGCSTLHPTQQCHNSTPITIDEVKTRP